MDAKALQLYCGGKVEIPHMALTLQKQHAILLYVDKCKKEGETPLSVSTLRRILDESKTSQRKALQGLDNYVVRGCSGIETLQQVTEKLQSLDASISTDADIKKIGPKRFLKNSYRKHVSNENATTSNDVHYCQEFALSDPKESTSMAKCENKVHTLSYRDCSSLEEISS